MLQKYARQSTSEDADRVVPRCRDWPPKVVASTLRATGRLVCEAREAGCDREQRVLWIDTTMTLTSVRAI